MDPDVMLTVYAPDTNFPNEPDAQVSYRIMQVGDSQTQLLHDLQTVLPTHPAMSDTSGHPASFLGGLEFGNLSGVWNPPVAWDFASYGYPIAAKTKTAPPPAWRAEIENASACEEIAAALRSSGLGDLVDAADRLDYLLEEIDDDPEEPPVDIESLRAAAVFLSERHLPDPEVGVAPNGLVGLEWRIMDGGILGMTFLPSGLIRFAAIASSGPSRSDERRVSGTLTPEEALVAVRPFTEEIRWPYDERRVASLR